MLTSGTSGGAAPTYTIYTRGEGQLPNPNEWNSTLTSATREEILGERVNYLTLKRVELVGAQPPPIPYILGEMLNPVRIAKGARRTGAVRIATTKN